MDTLLQRLVYRKVVDLFAKVSILVLMDTLLQRNHILYLYKYNYCFNPCFNGYTTSTGTRNPEFCEDKLVSILVLMDTLLQHVYQDGKKSGFVMFQSLF